jgi:hypothetical protein
MLRPFDKVRWHGPGDKGGGTPSEGGRGRTVSAKIRSLLSHDVPPCEVRWHGPGGGGGGVKPMVGHHTAVPLRQGLFCQACTVSQSAWPVIFPGPRASHQSEPDMAVCSLRLQHTAGWQRHDGLASKRELAAIAAAAI